MTGRIHVTSRQYYYNRILYSQFEFLLNLANICKSDVGDVYQNVNRNTTYRLEDFRLYDVEIWKAEYCPVSLCWNHLAKANKDLHLCSDATVNIQLFSDNHRSSMAWRGVAWWGVVWHSIVLVYCPEHSKRPKTSNFKNSLFWIDNLHRGNYHLLKYIFEILIVHFFGSIKTPYLCLHNEFSIQNALIPYSAFGMPKLCI